MASDDRSLALRVYVALPSTADPQPAFVLHDLRPDAPAAMIAIERTEHGPGALRTVHSKPAFVEATQLAHGVLGIVDVPHGARQRRPKKKKEKKSQNRRAAIRTADQARLGAGGSYLALVRASTRVGALGAAAHAVHRIDDVALLPFATRSGTLDAAAAAEARAKECEPVRKFLAAGDCFFAPRYNLTRAAQRLEAAREAGGGGAATADDDFDDWLDDFDEAFFWYAAR